MVMASEEVARVQRRTLRVLAVGQMVGSAAMGASVTVGAFVIQDLLGTNSAWVGIATATVTFGAAVFARLLSGLMHRHGRRPGMQAGYGIAALGGVIAAVAVELGWLGLFLTGLALFGGGQASNLLARYAATDLAEPEHRGQAMSQVVFASTFGAVFGPVLIGPAERAGQAWFGLSKYSGPWLFAALLFAAAGANTAVNLRPDPLRLANERRSASYVAPIRSSLAASVRLAMGSAPARLGVAAMVISQFTMVAVMAMTPVHMKLHGHEDVSQFVVSLHIAGMYAFAPLVGRFADRRGRQVTIEIGAAVLVGSSLLAALSGDAYLLLFPALWALGVGWNFGLIGGSSLLSESVAAEHRVGVQGTADLLMSVCGGIAGFTSGFIRKAFGFHLLAAGATVAAGLMLVAGYTAVARARRAAAVRPQPVSP